MRLCPADQPQRVGRHRNPGVFQRDGSMELLRLVFDTAAVRHPADTFELVVENSIQREGNPQIQTLDMFRRPLVPNESSDRLNFLLVRRAATAGSA